MHNSRRGADYDVEVAACHGRTRGTPPGTVVHLPWNAGGGNASLIRLNFRGGGATEAEQIRFDVFPE